VYADDHRGFLPHAKDREEPRAYESLQVLVAGVPEARLPELYVCPASHQEKAPIAEKKRQWFELSEDTVSYAWPRAKSRLSENPYTSIISCDRRVADGSAEFPENHRGGMNVLRTDGSVRWVSLEDLELDSPGEVAGFLEENGLTD
jgi:prepilin-type processing-associated H-X9-DG protein